MVDGATISEIYQRQWQAGERRSVVDADGMLWMGDSRSAAQVHLWAWPDPPELTFYVLPAGGHRYAHRCWVTSHDQGLIHGRGDERSSQPIPADAVDVLAHALPLPRPWSLYGYIHDGRVVALYYTWPGAGGDDALHVSDFLIPGTPEPGMVRTTDGTQHLAVGKWWDAVDRGVITRLDADIARSAGRVEMGKRHDTYHYVLVRGTEAWTGIDGPALYTYAGTGGLSLDEALHLHETDIRPRLAAITPTALRGGSGG